MPTTCMIWLVQNTEMALEINIQFKEGQDRSIERGLQRQDKNFDTISRGVKITSLSRWII